MNLKKKDRRSEEATAAKEGAGGIDAWTEMPSISQGAKALEMAPSFRESEAEGEINCRREEGTVRAGNCL